MTEQEPDQVADSPRPPRRPAKRELDAVFGDVLPDTTSDEREPEARSRDSDAWHLENRPPHHDR
ncbi:hypothetical protein [Amycolatopsis palatopharyngis]|uniref:hypothetical protein n=1 Tax=Amycolatopsis palatopharyngis TaxID=187982 RepID=UPI000E26BB9F|nr:hypothetical protein [Amycolatopsis palatopharyngis]